MNYQERHWKSKFGVKYTKRNKKLQKTHYSKCSKKSEKLTMYLNLEQMLEII